MLCVLALAGVEKDVTEENKAQYVDLVCKWRGYYAVSSLSS